MIKNIKWIKNANGYRLATEAEWENVAKANAWGLYNMSGNVSEWCMDEFYPTSYQDQGRLENPVVFDPRFENHMKHVLRGGCYQDRDVLCLVETRGGASIFDPQPFRGFRLARGPFV